MSPATAPAEPGGRRGRGPKKRRPMWLRVLLWCLLALVTLGVVGVVAIVALYMTIDIPKPNQATQAQISTVYFSDGTTEMGHLSGGTNRQNVSLSQVPDHVQKAFLAAEDRSFYSNKGISPSGIGRAIKVGLEGGQTQGGSTITQQYVKNTFLTSDQTIQRKVKEIFISVKIDQQRSKDQILEDYLNTIYFGRGASGIQTASQAYFGKDVSRLTPAEGALLASVIRGPSIYDPSRSAANLARSKERVAWILDGMVQEGWLSPAQRAAAAYPAVQKPKPLEITGGTNGYLVSMAEKELTSQAHLDDDQLKKGGLKVVTTIDKKYQDAMIEAIHDRGAADDIPGAQTGMVAMKPGTGEIEALYGGEDFGKRPYDNAVDAKISAGSTFKAYASVAALEQGYSTRSRVSGASPYDVPGTDDRIENEYNQQYGYIDVRQALANSVNTAFVRINQKIGPDNTRKAAIQAGIPAGDPGVKDDNLTNTLGTASLSVLDNTNGYATIAAQGRRATPHLVKTAKSADGDVDYTAKDDAQQAIDHDIAVDVTDALRYPIKEGTATYAQRLGRDAMGKTGTSEDHKEVWFVGSVPQLTAGCAIYKPSADGKSNEPLGRNVGGFRYCVPIWTQFMRHAMADQDEQRFPDRVGVNDDERKSFGARPAHDPSDDATDGSSDDGNGNGSTDDGTGSAGDQDRGGATQGSTDAATPTGQSTGTSDAQPSQEPTRGSTQERGRATSGAGGTPTGGGGTGGERDGGRTGGTGAQGGTGRSQAATGAADGGSQQGARAQATAAAAPTAG